MSERLKACPFCGDAASTVEIGRKFWAICNGRIDPYCIAASYGAKDNSFPSREEAIAAWNTRAVPTPTSAEVERVARALCEYKIRKSWCLETRERYPDIYQALIDKGWPHWSGYALAALSHSEKEK